MNALEKYAAKKHLAKELQKVAFLGAVMKGVKAARHGLTRALPLTSPLSRGATKATAAAAGATGGAAAVGAAGKAGDAVLRMKRRWQPAKPPAVGK